MADNDNDSATGNGTDTQAQPEQHFAIQKIYLKDSSFETPGAPEIFRSTWQPEANVELNTRRTKLDDEGGYEVVVTVTVTARHGEKTAYLCEVHQAGVFTLSGLDDATRDGVLGSYCPGILFPYAREAISDLTSKGGFPPMMLSPVNFDAIYAQQRARAQSQDAQPQ